MRSSDPGFFGIGEEVDAAYLSYLSRSVEPIPIDIFQAGKALPLRMVDRLIFGWVLKLGGVDATLAVKATSLVVGGVLGGLLYSLVALFARSRRIALVVTLVALIPSAYALHVFRDSFNRAVVSSDEASLLSDSAMTSGLASWVRKTIQGTPCFIAACDGDGVKILPAQVGLPACRLSPEPQAVDTQQLALCKLDEPSAAFARMMELGVELFITPAEQVAKSDSGRRRISGFIQRPELFCKIFDDGHYAVFVPAFSKYFPRAKDPLSS
jgi:hypothetical protein